MPFIEIKSTNKNYVRFTKYGRIIISKDIYQKWFKNKRIRVFLDSENRIIGLKPSDEGYKISTTNYFYRIKCAVLCKIVNGEFTPRWSNKHKMLLIKY